MNQKIEEIVARVLAELKAEGFEPRDATHQKAQSVIHRDGGDLVIDLADPTEDAPRHAMLVDNPADADGLRNLMATTSARLGVGRAGPRPKTATALLFQADHGVTQDAIYGVVSQEIRDHFNLFTVTTKVEDRAEFLLRPDLGRLLNDEAKKLIEEKCVKGPDVQLCVVDGLSAAAIDNNLRDIYPVIEQGLKSSGLTVGTPFFVENGRVGLMNDINTIIRAKVVVLLIGERPGLGIADAMSAYMGFDPQPGKSDADRDLICMITTHGGTNPLEAGAYIVEFIKRMLKYSASGVKLREVAKD
ncbi:ethanolamine ammonia-lyase subunit EutC [Tessaracoccus lubricantis]|uniref:Ethanolamine ammonia-lyase small subunit n=1 Tax=Tessaracoccus lubricantis TaxID=545543 RepID=A0ABP9FLS2_9ACTN